MELNQLVWYSLPALAALLIGYFVGTRRGRKVSKRALQKYNEQSLELLDARTELMQARTTPEQHERRERLLKLVMVKLQTANREIKSLQLQRDALNKRHLLEISSMRARADEAFETARRACEIAINATERLDNLARLAKDGEPMSFEMDETVPVSLAERALMHGSSRAGGTDASRRIKAEKAEVEAEDDVELEDHVEEHDAEAEGAREFSTR